MDGDHKGVVVTIPPSVYLASVACAALAASRSIMYDIPHQISVRLSIVVLTSLERLPPGGWGIQRYY